MNIEDSSNVKYQKFQINDQRLKEKYLFLNSLRIPFISHVITTILYEIIKFSETFPNRDILSIQYWCSTESTAISIFYI